MKLGISLPSERAKVCTTVIVVEAGSIVKYITLKVFAPVPTVYSYSSNSAFGSASKNNVTLLLILCVMEGYLVRA